MVATITPVVHGGRRIRWAGSLGLHVLGATAAAGAFGAGLGALGALLRAPWGGAGAAMLAVLAAAYAARELFGLPLPVLERRRQVPQWWRTYFHPAPAALLYGAGLGIGFLTYQRTGTLAVVAAASVGLGDPWTGALLLAPFGVARALAVGVVGAARTSSQVRAIVDRLEDLASSRLLPVANGIVLAAVAVAAASQADGLEGLPEAASAALAVTFGWAAVAKLSRPRRWRGELAAYRLGGLETAAAIAVPVTEAAIPLFVLTGRTAPGAALALGLLGAFTVAAARARTAEGVPCGCFGGRRSRPLRWVIGRNATLAVLAIGGLGAQGAPLPGWSPPASGEVLPALLAALGVAGALGLALAWRALLHPTGADATDGQGPGAARGRSRP